MSVGCTLLLRTLGWSSNYRHSLLRAAAGEKPFTLLIKPLSRAGSSEASDGREVLEPDLRDVASPQSVPVVDLGAVPQDFPPSVGIGDGDGFVGVPGELRLGAVLHHGGTH